MSFCFDTTVPRLSALLFLVVTASSCASGSGGSSMKQGATAPSADPLFQQDRLAESFSRYEYSFVQEAKPSAELSQAFSVVRREAGWGAFVDALAVCDESVNQLLEQNILDWSSAGSKIELVNQTRNAWRRACTYGVTPPDLPRGWITFQERGIEFSLHVTGGGFGGSKKATLAARAPRGQMIGFFELALWDGGSRHVTEHMLQGPLRYPDAYLNYPWNILMATDTIFVDDVWVELDRVNSKVRVGERFGPKEEVEAGN